MTSRYSYERESLVNLRPISLKYSVLPQIKSLKGKFTRSCEELKVLQCSALHKRGLKVHNFTILNLDKLSLKRISLCVLVRLKLSSLLFKIWLCSDFFISDCDEPKAINTTYIYNNNSIYCL